MKYILTLIFTIAFSFFSIGEEQIHLRTNQLDSLVKSDFIIKGETPIRFYSNLLIQLQGNPTKEDSLIFQELVGTLNELIEKWDVYLIPEGTSNLIVKFNESDKVDSQLSYSKLDKNKLEIIKSTIVIEMPSDTEFTFRKKVIRYQLLRSLVHFTPSQNLSKVIPGSVFAESKISDITFSPVDFQIVKKLYSEKYDNQLKKPQGISWVRGISDLKKTTIKLVGSLIAFLLSTSFLVLMFFFGKFTEHNYHFLAFLKQGLIVLFSCMIYVAIIFASLVYTEIRPINMLLKLTISTTLAVLILGLVTIILVYFSEKTILKGSSFYLLDILFPIFTISIIPTVLILIVFQLSPKPYTSSNPLNLLNLMFMTLSVTLFIATVRAVFIFLNKKSESIIHKKDVELAKLGELHKQAELQSIRSKINPHFLYNSLNSIASLATTDAQKTEQMALALSDFFKYSINREQKQFNTIQEELNAVHTYLEIEKVRFGEQLNFEIDCPSDLMGINIPQLLIQPLVENAIKHGLSKITEKGVLKIVVRKEEKQIKIQVFDNGPDFPDGPLTGFGIRNTSERVELLYGKGASINWKNGEGKFIELNLPKSKLG